MKSQNPQSLLFFQAFFLLSHVIEMYEFEIRVFFKPLVTQLQSNVLSPQNCIFKTSYYVMLLPDRWII